MHKTGHLGISLLLTAPFVAVFLILDWFVFAILLTAMTAKWCSLPDIDIPLQKYETISYSEYKTRHWKWIPILSFSIILMNIASKFTSRIPSHNQLEKVSHRGVTHTFWFALALGLVLAGITSFFLVSLTLIELYFSYSITEPLLSILNAPTELLVVIAFLGGFLSVTYHCVGDIFTPTGIHFFTLYTNWGFSFDQFYAKNKVANRSAFPFGVMTIGYAIFVGLTFGNIPTIYLFAGFLSIFIVGIPLWLVFVRTPIGRWFYRIYDFFD